MNRGLKWVAAFFSVLALALSTTQQAAAEWEQLNGPIGGIVNRMIVVDGVPMATLYSGGIYRRAEDRWDQIAINNGLPENRTFDLAVHPTDTNIIYATQMIACGAKSVDGGATWQGLCDPILELLGADNYSSDVVLIDPQNPDTIYFAGHDNNNVSTFLRTDDGGETFQVVHTFDELIFFNSVVLFHDTFFLGTREHGVLASEDEGVTWEDRSTGLAMQQIIQFAVDETNDRLFLATGLMQYNIRVGGPLYALTNDDALWQQVNDVPEDVTGIGVSPEGRLYVGTESGEFWKETNGGDFENALDGGALPGLVSEIVKTKDGLYVGVGGFGVYYSSDGGNQFSSANKGLSAIATRDTIVHPTNSDKAYVVTWDRLGVYRTTNGGDSFAVIGKNNSVSALAIEPANFNRFYAASESFFDVRVRKNKADWVEHPLPVSKTDATAEAIAVNPDNPDHVLLGIGKRRESPPGYGLWYSLDRGATWKRAKNIPKKKTVTSIVFNPKNPEVVYAVSFGNGIYKSTNGGRLFESVGGEELRYTYRLAISARDPHVLVAGSNLFFAGLSTADQYSGLYGGIFQTRDAGKTWNEITAGVRDYEGDESTFELWKYNFGHLPNYERMLVNPNDPDHIIVGHHGESVVLTRDGGVTWEKQAGGMIPGSMHNYAYCVSSNADFTRVYSCSCGRGLFKGTISSDKIIAASDDAVETSSPDDASQQDVAGFPRTATAAKQFILSGGHIHSH